MIICVVDFQLELPISSVAWPTDLSDSQATNVPTLSYARINAISFFNPDPNSSRSRWHASILDFDLDARVMIRPPKLQTKLLGALNQIWSEFRFIGYIGIIEGWWWAIEDTNVKQVALNTFAPLSQSSLLQSRNVRCLFSQVALHSINT